MTRIRAYHRPDNSRPETILVTGTTERQVRRAAAQAMGSTSLRGLLSAPTERGVRYYGRGADDDFGQSVEIVYEEV